MKNNFLIILLLLLVSKSAISQPETYRTIKGDITFTIPYKDYGVIASSNQLIALLDYNTGKLIFHVLYATFHTGIDSIDEELNRAPAYELKFEGTLDIFINSKKKTPQDYNTTGMMTSGKQPFFAEGNGTVVCIPVASYDAVPSCQLIATIKCKLSDLNLSGVFINADDNIQIDIRQSILEKE